MNRDMILLCTGQRPMKVAEMLAEALHATLRIDDDTPVVFRQVNGEWRAWATVGGKVRENYLHDDTAGPDEQSMFDFGYDTLYDVWVSRNVPGEVVENLQEDEARRIFDEITERLPFPAVHAQDGGLIKSAWDSKVGRTDFPPGTGSDAEYRDRWEQYTHPNAS